MGRCTGVGPRVPLLPCPFGRQDPTLGRVSSRKWNLAVFLEGFGEGVSRAPISFQGTRLNKDSLTLVFDDNMSEKGAPLISGLKLDSHFHLT